MWTPISQSLAQAHLGVCRRSLAAVLDVPEALSAGAQ
ncbi:hypothetical protein NONI108955_12640 [Nocardia ninae]